MINDRIEITTKPLKVAVAAGESQPLNINARFIFVDSMTAAGELWLIGDRTEIRLIQGRQIRLPLEEISVRLENRTGSNVETVLLMGNVDVTDHSIVGDVAVSELQAFKAGLTLDVVNDISALRTTGYFRNSATTAVGTIVTPAANTDGIIISSYSISVASATGVRLMAKASVASGWGDAAALTIVSNFHNTDRATLNKAPIPLFIPAGYGLYEAASSAGHASEVSVTYEVL